MTFITRQSACWPINQRARRNLIDLEYRPKLVRIVNINVSHKSCSPLSLYIKYVFILRKKKKKKKNSRNLYNLFLVVYWFLMNQPKADCMFVYVYVNVKLLKYIMQMYK